MSRVNENQEMVERLTKIRFTDTNTAMIASVLVDISQSLAILADIETLKNLIPKPEVDDGKNLR